MYFSTGIFFGWLGAGGISWVPSGRSFSRGNKNLLRQRRRLSASTHGRSPQVRSRLLSKAFRFILSDSVTSTASPGDGKRLIARNGSGGPAPDAY
jgi:hypothetical protein